MVLAPQLSVYSNASDHDSLVDVDVLLPIPKGIMISVKVNADCTFADIKDKVWQKIANMMDLGPKERFSFEGINESAMIERFEDDKMTLRDSKLFTYLLKLVEMRIVDVDKKFLANLSMLAGRNVIMEVSKFPSLEVEEFHDLMEETALNYNKLRATHDYRTLLKIKYPLRLMKIEGTILEHEQLYNTMQYTLYIDSSYRLIPNSTSGNWEKVENFMVPFRASVQLLLDVLVEVEKLVPSNNYLLKISGCEDYLFEDKLILPEYKYIQDCIRDNRIPDLILTTYEELIKSNQITMKPSNTSRETFKQHEIFPMSPLHFEGNQGDKYSSEIKEKFSVCVRSLSDLNLDRSHLVRVYVALYSGKNRLEQLVTCEKPITSVIEWNETLTFKINISDLPRNAKLCFSIQKRRKTDDTKKKNKQNAADEQIIVPSKSANLYWINLTVFDFKGTLRQGAIEQHVWTDLRSESGFNYTGPSFPYGLSDTPIFTVELPESKSPVRFYPLLTARNLALQDTGPGSLSQAEQSELTVAERRKLETLLNHSFGTYQMTEEDNNFLWKNRVHCRSYPHSLPKLVLSTSMDSLEKSTQLYTLLLDWPPISVVTALQCFLHEINDPHIREFAVYSLDTLLPDDMVCLYLLQLVECIKYDLYLDCALTRFLLRRALQNNTLGHYLYWHLKSQVDGRLYGAQFALVIEFYLRCCGDHIEELNKISNSMSKIGLLYEKVSRKVTLDEIKSTLNSPAVNKTFCGFQNLTDPRQRTKDILVEKTKIFDSSMRPMLMKFTNQDPTYKLNFGIIYKEGDDLRQGVVLIVITHF
ncbi:phosphatidylinositol 4,5-bisphosphate 3-kinase catalytic subunit beta isoform-like [Bolinopsis microptera]|uniref:phosphatidylinositol 4,5-bisphosphate 3-kinase catalytic subunit beta isoform-like n=1 Tax=Bolinopsis microptera TaxID=2820187 RepID=UPI0030798EA6